MRSQVDFLGYKISSQIRKPTDSKINHLKSFPLPNDSQSLRHFLGMVGFYRHLVNNFSLIIFPLSECIKQNPKSKPINLSD